MSNVLSIDIETGNTAADIGGWNNTHMWKVTCATTWDGEKAVVYMDNDIEMKEDVEVKSLRQLKYDLDDHFEKGGKLLGHNIIAFALVMKTSGKRVHLDNLVKCTLGSGKSADGLQAVDWWHEGKYTDIAKYCLMDSQLTYDLWKHGCEKGTVDYFDEDDNIMSKIEIEW